MNQLPQIIARAFDDEPIVLFAHDLQPSGRHVNVSRHGDEAKIGWPVADAFDYDIDDFARLWAAYSMNDKIGLAMIYAELRGRKQNYVRELTET